MAALTTAAANVWVQTFHPKNLALAWKWINEFPERNLDDYGPHDEASFVADMLARRVAGEKTWCAYKNGEPCGIIGYKPWTPTHGVFHGICFTQAAWGRETTATAVKLVLGQIFYSGVEKVSAFHFADNVKINRFLRDLGAVQEGYLVKQALRGGELIDMVLLALFKESVCR